MTNEITNNLQSHFSWFQKFKNFTSSSQLWYESRVNGVDAVFCESNSARFQILFFSSRISDKVYMGDTRRYAVTPSVILPWILLSAVNGATSNARVSKRRLWNLRSSCGVKCQQWRMRVIHANEIGAAMQSSAQNHSLSNVHAQFASSAMCTVFSSLWDYVVFTDSTCVVRILKR